MEPGASKTVWSCFRAWLGLVTMAIEHDPLEELQDRIARLEDKIDQHSKVRGEALSSEVQQDRDAGQITRPVERNRGLTKD